MTPLAFWIAVKLSQGISKKISIVLLTDVTEMKTNVYSYIQMSNTMSEAILKCQAWLTTELNHNTYINVDLNSQPIFLSVLKMYSAVHGMGRKKVVAK